MEEHDVAGLGEVGGAEDGDGVGHGEVALSDAVLLCRGDVGEVEDVVVVVGLQHPVDHAREVVGRVAHALGRELLAGERFAVGGEEDASRLGVVDDEADVGANFYKRKCFRGLLIVLANIRQMKNFCF